MNAIPGLKIKGLEIPYCIFQGGMGVAVGRPRLTREVFRCGGLGVLSSAGLKEIYSLEKDKKYTTYEAVREEIETAMADGYKVGINVMCRLKESYDETIRAAIDAKVSALIVGAGLPRRIKGLENTVRIVIVSSARALELILARWKPERPDVVIVEGPKAGGHLGFKIEDIDKPEFSLENIIPRVLEVTSKNGNIPVIAAGGICKEDILKLIGIGVVGVQMATYFLATHESNASDEFKRQIVNCTEQEIKVVLKSPCDFPFRILTTSPMSQKIRLPRCDMGCVLDKDSEGRFTVCKAHPNNPQNKEYFCICNGLRAAIGLAPNEPPLYTVGSNAYQIKKIVTVAELMQELTS